MIGQVSASPIITFSLPDRIIPPATLFVDINISGLQSGGLDSLGAFDLNVNFDSSIFEYKSVQWGSGLGDVALGDAITFDTVTPVLNPIWAVNLTEVSFLPITLLQPLQSGYFTLATLEFYAPNAAVYPYQTFFSAPANQIILADANGDQIAYPGFTQFTTILLRDVPEPACVYLFVIGLLGFVIFRRGGNPSQFFRR